MKRNLSYPYNLISIIMHYEESDIYNMDFPEDILESVNYVLHTLDKTSQLIINYHYRDELIMREIATNLGITKEAAISIEKKAIKSLRHPSRSKYVRYGIKSFNKKPISNSSDSSLFYLVNPYDSIHELNITSKDYYILKAADIHTIGDLVSMKWDDFIKIRGIRDRSIRHIISKLEQYSALPEEFKRESEKFFSE